MEANNVRSVSENMIPQFKAIFEQVKPNKDIIEELSRQDKDSQQRIFNCFREIMQDELRFVIFIYEHQAKV